MDHLFRITNTWHIAPVSRGTKRHLARGLMKPTIQSLIWPRVVTSPEKRSFWNQKNFPRGLFPQAPIFHSVLGRKNSTSLLEHYALSHAPEVRLLEVLKKRRPRNEVHVVDKWTATYSIWKYNIFITIIAFLYKISSKWLPTKNALITRFKGKKKSEIGNQSIKTIHLVEKRMLTTRRLLGGPERRRKRKMTGYL